MDAEEQIRKLKQIPPLTKEEKRKKLITAIVLSVATFISVLFLVYAFMQKLEADKNSTLARLLKIEADLFRVEAERLRDLADKQRIESEVSRAEADRQRLMALEALENCKKNKR